MCEYFSSMMDQQSQQLIFQNDLSGRKLACGGCQKRALVLPAIQLNAHLSSDLDDAVSRQMKIAACIIGVSGK